MQDLIQVKLGDLVTHYRQDSCRICGRDTSPLNFCLDCKQPNQFQCRKCQLYLDEEIHFSCKNSRPLN